MRLKLHSIRPMTFASLFAVTALIATPRVARADDRTDIELASKRYASLLKATDAVNIAAMFTPDGEVLNPGMDVVRGPEAIRKFLGAIGEVNVEVAEMTAGDIELMGNDAVQWGEYSQRVILPGQRTPISVRGRYVAHWKKQADGRWLLRRMLTQPKP